MQNAPHPHSNTFVISLISCVVFGLGEWETEADVIYHNCSSEKDLLAKFMQYWREEWFDIITGWNAHKFENY